MSKLGSQQDESGTKTSSPGAPPWSGCATLGPIANKAADQPRASTPNVLCAAVLSRGDHFHASTRPRALIVRQPARFAAGNRQNTTQRDPEEAASPRGHGENWPARLRDDANQSVRRVIPLAWPGLSPRPKARDASDPPVRRLGARSALRVSRPGASLTLGRGLFSLLATCFRGGATICRPYRSCSQAPLRTGQADFPYIRLPG